MQTASGRSTVSQGGRVSGRRGIFHAAGLAAGTLLLALGTGAWAGIALQEGITPSTAWPAPVTIQTGDPGANTTGVGVNAATVVSQTFTPTAAMTLDAVYFSYSTTAASASGSFGLRIQTVPGGAAAQTYAQGTNLLPSGGFTFSLAGTAGAIKLLKFTFSGADRLILAAGTTYAVEITSSSSAVTFYRRGADTYSAGNAYSNRSAINYPNTRDLAMAVAATAGGGSMTLTENIAPALDWPEPLTVQTGDPGDNTTGVGVNASTVVSETFTPGTNFNLGAIYFSYSTSTASTANAFTVRIQAVAGGAAAQTYAQSTDLLGGGTPVTFSLAGTGGAIRLMKMSFAGSYQIPLTAGTTYAVEISSTGSGLTFYRRGADTYAGGALYTNRSAFNYPSTRDLAVGIVVAGGAPMGGGGFAGTSYLPIPQNFSIQTLVYQDGSEKDLVAAAGFKNTRKGVYWSVVETTSGTYNFGSYDSIITGYLNRGVQPWITLYSGNTLYGEPAKAVQTAAGRAGFAEFARRTALHYPQVKTFEIWNEPNILSGWTPQPSAQNYCDLVAATASAVRSATPDAKIIGGATNVIPYVWLESCFQRGLLNHVDAISVHPYRGGFPETVLNEYRQLRAFIQQYAPAGKQIDIISGEWGYHTDSTGDAVTETQQAQYAARMFLTHLTLGMPLQNWYSWKDNSTDPNNFEHFGLVTNTLGIKPSYTAMQTLATVMEGCTFQQRLAYANGEVWALAFTDDAGAAAYALWTTGADASIQIPIAAAGSGTLTAMAGTQQTISWAAGGPTVTVTQSPQYLRLGSGGAAAAAAALSATAADAPAADDSY